MKKLIHDKDLKLYQEFMNLPGPKEHCLQTRVDNFYSWCVAKGYKTHRKLLPKPLPITLNDYLVGGNRKI